MDDSFENLLWNVEIDLEKKSLLQVYKFSSGDYSYIEMKFKIVRKGDMIE
jgi:hypothetical protein